MVYITVNLENLKKIYAIIIPMHLILFVIDYGTTAFYFMKLEGFTEGNFFYANLGYSLEVTIICSALFLIFIYCFLYFLVMKTENRWVKWFSLPALLALPNAGILALSLNFSTWVMGMSLLGVVLFSGISTGISTSILFYYLRRIGCISVRKERLEVP